MTNRIAENRDPLYPVAAAWVEARKGKTITYDWFRRSMAVGWIKRDRLLIELEDAGLIRRAGRNTFEVVA